jgi:eukaryotic-like serine/threonine-protein kinase
MDPETWARIKQIVNACLDMQPDDREAHARQACAGNTQLLAEVKSLLASHSEMGDFMASSVLDTEREEIPSGGQIGPYRVLERIGEGGMGIVYRAVRVTDFQMQVAIKVVKRGMDTSFVLRRFGNERQILAGLDHPNIARLLDGGATQDGRPYLVMDYIEGTPITEYAEGRSLAVSERLQLFRMVCAAVEYAHQNLVVHRDLKPGNILVTAEGVPKLLDFGIAKLLEPEADVTMTSLRLMTPECASPEQVLGQSITTATDVYALGVLLYYLLTGESPYRFTTRTPEEIQRIVCDTEPKRPGAVRPLAEDLDTIVLKAMHKDPAHRYGSADRLSEDIRRHLAGLPVTARKDTFRYRASKFVGRHKAASLAAAVVAFALIGGMGATLWEARVARMERAKAERRFNDVRKLANSLLFDIHDSIRDLPGATRVRKLLVDRAREYLESLRQESAGDASLQREIATAYEKVGDVQGRYGNANLGDSAGALESLRKAMRLREQIAADRSANAGDRLALAADYRRFAAQLMANGSPAAAVDAIKKAVAISEQMNRGGNYKVLDELSSDYEVFGLVLRRESGYQAKLPEILLCYRKALASGEAMLKIDPGSEDARRGVEIYSMHVGDALRWAGDLDGCLANYERGLELARLLQSGSAAASRRRDVAVAYNRMGLYYERAGDRKRQLEAYQQNRKIYTELAAADPNNATAQWDLANADLNVGDVLAKTGQVRQALALMNQAVQKGEMLSARDPANSDDRRTLGVYYMTRAEARGQTNMASGALDDFGRALSIFQERSAEGRVNADDQIEMARCHATMGGVSVKAGLLDQAERSFQKALEICRPYAAASPPKVSALRAIFDSYGGLGDIFAARAAKPGMSDNERRKHWIEARSYYQQSLKTRSLIGDPSPGMDVMGSARSTKEIGDRIARCDRELGVKRTDLPSLANPN